MRGMRLFSAGRAKKKKEDEVKKKEKRGFSLETDLVSARPRAVGRGDAEISIAMDRRHGLFHRLARGPQWQFVGMHWVHATNGAPPQRPLPTF